MPSRLVVAALFLLNAAGAPLSASAPGEHSDPTPIVVGQTVHGELNPGAPMLADRGRFQLLAFDAQPGRRYVITMRSTDFDAFLTVARQVGGITETLATDDDGGGGTDARLRFTAPEAGRFLIVAQSLEADGLGTFTVQLDHAPEVIERTHRIRPGDLLRGELEETNPTLDDGSHYDRYAFQAEGGQRFTATMRSGALDSFLYLARMVAGELEILAGDDDSGGGRDARLRFTAPESGEYLILASSLAPDETGGYEISLEDAPPAALPAARPLRPGRSVRGELTTQHPDTDAGSYFDLWSYSGRAGERLRIAMQSGRLDAYLEIGRVQDGEFVEIAADDDGGEGTDALLEFVLPQSGEYLVRARSFGRGETGAYTRRLERGRR
jgi:hypothetical protein